MLDRNEKKWRAVVFSVLGILLLVGLLEKDNEIREKEKLKESIVVVEPEVESYEIILQLKDSTKITIMTEKCVFEDSGAHQSVYWFNEFGEENSIYSLKENLSIKRNGVLINK